MRYVKKTKAKLDLQAVVCLLSSSLLLCTISLNEFAQAQNANIIPGRVMVKFKYDEIELPEGATKAEIGQINIRSVALKKTLRRFKIGHIAKVVLEAVKGDTLRVFADGRRIKLNNFSQVFMLTFPALENCPLHPERLEKELPTAIKMMKNNNAQAMFTIPLSEKVPDLTSKADILKVQSYLEKLGIEK